MGSTVLVSAVLVAYGMDWNGLGMIAAGGVLAIAGIMYLLRGVAPDGEAQ